MARITLTFDDTARHAGFSPAPPFRRQPLQNPAVFEFGCAANVVSVRKNKHVIIADKHYECVYFNCAGWLCRYKILHNGDRQIIDFILPGQIFGLEACLFKRALYSVAAVTDASLLTLPLGMIDGVLERDLKLSNALFWSAMCQASILGEHLTNAARRCAYEAVGHLLLELFVRLNAVGLTEGMTFSMPLTQELIGDALGLTPVHVNRTLRALRDDRLVAIDGRSITILDFEALALLCDFEPAYLGATAGAPQGGL